MHACVCCIPVPIHTCMASIRASSSQKAWTATTLDSVESSSAAARSLACLGLRAESFLASMAEGLWSLLFGPRMTGLSRSTGPADGPMEARTRRAGGAPPAAAAESALWRSVAVVLRRSGGPLLLLLLVLVLARPS